MSDLIETVRYEPRRIGELFGLSVYAMIAAGIIEPTLSHWHEAERQEIARRGIRRRLRRLWLRLWLRRFWRRKGVYP